MASNINSTSIDENFPVAGVDNPTQGFRDNFTYIKDSLAAAKTEIEELQTKSVFKSALTGTTLSNDFNGSNIQEANLKACTEETFSISNVSSNLNLSFTNGSYQVITVSGDVTLTLTDWPASGRCGRIRVELYGEPAALRTVVFSAGVGTLRKPSDWPTSITIQSITQPKIFEFWTYNGGTTVFAKYLGEFL